MRKECKVPFQSYFQAEALKYQHTAIAKLTVLMPMICVVLSATLTHTFFAVDGYNWWYVGLYPGFVALVCGIISEKDKKMGNRAVWSLPCDMGRIWDAKVLYGVLVSGVAMLLLTGVTMGVAFLLETQFHVTFIIRPSVPAQLTAGLLLWISFLWQIPWCLFLSQTLGRIPMLLIHLAGYEVMAVILSLSPIYMYFPGAIASRMMCVVLKVMPNGLPAQTGEMTFAPRLLDASSIPIGIVASILWFVLLWAVSRSWYKRKAERV